MTTTPEAEDSYDPLCTILTANWKVGTRDEE